MHRTLLDLHATISIQNRSPDASHSQGRSAQPDRLAYEWLHTLPRRYASSRLRFPAFNDVVHQSQQLTSSFRVGCVTDGLDDGRVEASGTPSGFGGFEQVIHGSVFSVRPVMAPQVVPQILDWIQLR